MLQVLLMILKILGILILVILGIILAVLLLVLFVPVRYRVDAAFDGKPGGGVLVSWLMHLVTVRVSYDGNATALVKVLWFRIFDKTVWPAEEESTNTADRADVQVGSVPEDEMDTIAPIEPVSVPKTVDSANTSVTSEAADCSRKPESATQRTAVSETQMPEVKESEVKESEDKESFISKINNAYQQICGKVNAGQEKVEQVRTFLNDQENRKTIGLLWRQVKKLLRHVLPRKISGRVRFGFDDPAAAAEQTETNHQRQNNADDPGRNLGIIEGIGRKGGLEIVRREHIKADAVGQNQKDCENYCQPAAFCRRLNIVGRATVAAVGATLFVDLSQSALHKG